MGDGNVAAFEDPQNTTDWSVDAGSTGGQRKLCVSLLLPDTFFGVSVLLVRVPVFGRYLFLFSALEYCLCSFPYEQSNKRPCKNAQAIHQQGPEILPFSSCQF